MAQIEYGEIRSAGDRHIEQGGVRAGDATLEH